MILLNVLRMTVDLSFYATLAVIVSTRFGGTAAMAGILLQALCFGLSAAGGRRRWLRLLLLLPIACTWLLSAGNRADCLLFVPSGLYIILLVWRNDYVLQYERQYGIFQAYWKIFLLLIPFLFIFGGGQLFLTIILPYGLLATVSSILLQQMLRHDPQIYCQPQYQLINSILTSGIAIAAMILSSSTFLNGCKAILRFLYRLLLRPVLVLLTRILEWIVWLLFRALGFLFGDDTVANIPMFGDPMTGPEGMEQWFGDAKTQADQIPWIRTLLWILAVVAIIVSLVVFFRLLIRRGTEAEKTATGPESRTDTASRVTRAAKKRETTELQKLRNQYRQFLKWRSKQGVPTKPHNTSLDVHRQVPSHSRETSAEIRDLYIQARYAGKAAPDSARHMKQLVAKIKQESNATGSSE